MYLKNRIVATVLIVSAFINGAFAQNDPNDLNISENIMGLSNAPTAQFAKPVTGSSDLYTGMATYSIPLFELKSYQLSLPVSINYASGGVRVSEIGGWLGISWKLNAGGEISREMNSYPDELPGKGYFVHGHMARDFESKTVEEKRDIIKKAQEDDYDLQPDVFHFNFPGGSGYFVFDNDQNIHMVPHRNWIIDKTIADDKLTGFTITTDDGTKYTFGNDENAIEETKISTLSSTAFWNFSGTMPFLDYDVFSIKEETRIDDFYNSKWYLREIISQTGDKITLSYDDAGTVSYVDAPQTLAYETITSLQWDLQDTYFGPSAALKPHLMAFGKLEIFGFNECDIEFIDDYLPTGTYPSCLNYETACKDSRDYAKTEFPLRYFFHQNKIETKTRILSEIRATNQTYISFASTGSSNRPGENRISRIALMNSADEEIKAFSLVYDKILSNSAKADGSTPDPFSPMEFFAFKGCNIPRPGDNYVPANRAQVYFSTFNPPEKELMMKYVMEGLKNYNYERYFLKSIRESANQTSLPPYIFEYNSPENIIRRTSMWSSILNYSIPYHSSQIVFRIAKSENYQLTDGLTAFYTGTSFGQLKKITLPTGGFVEYKYQPTKENSDSQDPIFGVKRVEQITRNDGNQSYIKTFAYKSIGHKAIISRERSFDYLDLFVSTIYRMNITSSYDLEGLDFTKGSPIGYDVVEVKNYAGPNENGYERFEFTSLKTDGQDDSGDILDIGGLNEDISYGHTFTYPKSYWLRYNCERFDYDRGDDPSPKYRVNFPTYTEAFSESNYQNFSSRDIARGLLKKHIIYKNTGPVKEIINNYAIADKTNVKGLNGRSFNFGIYKYIGDADCWPLFGCVDAWRDAFMRKDLANIFIHYSSAIELTSTTEINYNASAPGDKEKAITTVTEYSYNNRNQVEELTRYDAEFDINDEPVKISGTDEFKTEYRYTDEFTGDSPAQEMESRNILVPVEVINKKNDLILGASLTRYLSIGGVLSNQVGIYAMIPSVKYKLEIESPISDLSYQRGTSFLNLDDRCEIQARFDYDYYYNIKQTVDLKKDFNTTYIWGYDYLYPVAKIENFNYDLLTSALSSIGTSLDDIQTKSVGDTDEEDLIALFNELRATALMKDALISSYTYDPLIGMRSETDPSGKTTYYEYDDLGRLLVIKNHKGEIIKTYEYHP